MTAKPCTAALALAAGCFSSAAHAVQVDLLVLYDSRSRDYFSNQVGAAMRNWVAQMNAMNANSQVDVQWRLVGVAEREAPGTAGPALDALRADSRVASQRSAFGADFVVQLKVGADVCGLGYFAVDRTAAFSLMQPSCGPVTMAHELGHNMGLNHSRRQGNTGGVRYSYGLGYGVPHVFADIMAYRDVFQARQVAKYSNPNVVCVDSVFRPDPGNITVTQGPFRCGVANDADGARAINNVKHEIANFMSPVANPPRVQGPVGVTVFQHYGYGGYSATLRPGRYRLADLRTRGIRNDDLSSARVPRGMVLELYEHDNFTGTRTVYTADTSGFQVRVNDKTSSIIVRALGS